MASPVDPQPSRRVVIKTAAAASTLALGTRAFAARPRASDPEVLKIGLIGCGGRGSGAALNALRAEDGTVMLTALADVFPERMESCVSNLRKNLGDGADRVAVDDDHRFTGFDGYQKLLASDIDVVLIATPPGFRPEHLRAAVEAGKHIFAEKPMAVDGPGVRSVYETARMAKQKNLNLVSGFCWRRSIRHQAWFEQLLGGRLGDVRAFHSTYNASPIGTQKRKAEWSDMEFQLKNWHHFNWLSGDHIVEQACHSLDKQSWAMGDRPPLSVTAIGGRQVHRGDERGNIFDHFGATFDYGDGVMAFHQSRQMPNCDFENNDYVFCEKGHGMINGWAPLHVLEGGDDAWVYEGPGNDMYQQEHDDLFAAIRAGEVLHDGEWMTTSTMLAIMARMSAYTGKTITWEQALASTEHQAPETYAWGPVPVPPVPMPGTTRFV